MVMAKDRARRRCRAATGPAANSMGTPAAREEIYDGVSDRVVASNDEDPTHRQDSWRVTSMLLFVYEKALGIDDRRSRRQSERDGADGGQGPG